MSRRRAKRLGWLAVVVLAAIGMAIAWMSRSDGPRTNAAGQGAAKRMPGAADVTPRPDLRLAAVDIQAINGLMASTAGFRNDVLFLVVAAARDRCTPAESGSLARMANRAQLPVLFGVSQAIEAQPSLERPLYRYIQAAASAVKCNQPFRLAGVEGIDPDVYAQGFPDSFYTPARLGRIPSEYMGLNLQQRADEPCESIAYTVLPLGTPQWQCDATRSAARKKIVSYCVDQRSIHGLPLHAELTPSFGEAIAPGVAEILGSVPRTCVPAV